MGTNPSYIRLRNKFESDLFLSKEIHHGDVGAKKFEIPDSIAGKTVKVESVLGKHHRKRFIISYQDTLTGNKSFQTIHPSSIKKSYFYKKESSH